MTTNKFLTPLTEEDSSNALWLDKQLPRYTSYPPAPFFRDGVNGADYAQSLGSLPHGQSVSLYLHIPFCREMCLFCGCHTMITRRDERISAYLVHLKQEIDLVATACRRQLPVSHLHFGGGTPNILSIGDMADLFGTLRKAFGFSARAEIAMELDPRTLDHEKIRAMAACGVTRASLGVQDFNNDVQKAVHRIQPYEMVARACSEIRSAGIDGINFDLMYGLPGQTAESVADTTRQALTLRPDRIALFSYAHVPHFKIHQQALEGLRIPTGYERLAMEKTARNILRDSGYVEIGMDHFAMPKDSLTIALSEGRLRRNFQGYTDDQAPTLIALGASSIGYTPQGYFQNEKDIERYQNMVAGGTLPVTRSLVLTSEDRLRGEVIERLMCELACDIDVVCGRHGVSSGVFSRVFEALKPFIDSGLVRRDGPKIYFTGEHRMAIRAVASLFDAYAQPPTARAYSRVA